MIYLDNSATTYPKPEEVYQALDHANRDLAFNAGRGSYSVAQKVFGMIEETRGMIADLVHTDSENVCFQSSATDALNIIINGMEFNEGDHVYISPFEHNAVVRPLYNLKDKHNLNIHVLPFDEETWQVDTVKMDDLFALYPPKMVILSHISNVTGYILPFGLIFAHAKCYNAVTVLDGAQAFGVINPDPENIDFLIFAGHKSLYASFGIAGFINLGNVHLRVTKSGGTGSDSLNHEMPEYGHGRYESGSMNSVAIAGLNASLKWLKTVDVYNHEKELTEYLINALKPISKIKMYIPSNFCELFGIVSISVDGYLSEDVADILAEEFDICVRSGYHCSPFVHEFIGSLDSLGTVRISMGAFTTKEDVDELIEALRSL